MPTQVQPDNPNATLTARAQSIVGGPRDPGTPSMAGKPNVQPGATTSPNPPAPATAPVGRPAQPTPAPTTSPGTPAPAAGPSPAATSAPSAATPPTQPGGPTTPAAGAGSQVTQGTGPGAPAAPAAPTVDASGQATQTFTSPTLPTAGTVTPGAQVQTPLGTVSASPSGNKLALDAVGQQKYKETMAALRSKFTLPRVLKGMTGLPQMELKLGASNFDPFSGRFLGKE